MTCPASVPTWSNMRLGQLDWPPELMVGGYCPGGVALLAVCVSQRRALGFIPEVGLRRYRTATEPTRVRLFWRFFDCILSVLLPVPAFCRQWSRPNDRHIITSLLSIQEQAPRSWSATRPSNVGNRHVGSCCSLSLSDFPPTHCATNAFSIQSRLFWIVSNCSQLTRLFIFWVHQPSSTAPFHLISWEDSLGIIPRVTSMRCHFSIRYQSKLTK